MYINERKKGRRPQTHDVSHLLDGSAESLYWIGFIFANGNYLINKGEGRGIRVNCTEEEAGHITLLSRFLTFHTSPVLSNKKLRLYVITVYSTDALSYLYAMGFEQSMYDRHLTQPDMRNSPHFWRGFADGNGLLTESPTLTFSLQANHNIFPDFQTFLVDNHIDVRHQVAQIKRRYTEISLSGKQAIDVLTLLYGTHPLASPRMTTIAYRHIPTPGVFA